jgi:hypothetical protein
MLTVARAEKFLGRSIEAADTAVAELIKNSEAQSELVSLVITLFDVAIDADQAPREWKDVSCSDSLRSTLAQFDLEDEYEDQGDLFDVVNGYLEELADEEFEERQQAISDAVKNAKDLDDLRDALEEASEYADRYEIFIGDLYSQEDLKTFGGDAPENTEGVWSYDEKRVLYAHGTFTISEREEEAPETIDPTGCFEIGDIEYRFEESYYLGSQKVFCYSMWKEQDPWSSVFHGRITIPAFAADRVLPAIMERKFDEARNPEFYEYQ